MEHEIRPNQEILGSGEHELRVLRSPVAPQEDIRECFDIDPLHTIREELKQIQPSEGGDLPPPEVITGQAPIKADTPQEILRERQMKRTQLRRKETSPRGYSEMLICINDLQMLRNADDEAVGAMLKFVEANKGKITHFIANGDIADMEQANKFGYSPDMAGTMEDEVAAMQWFVDKISKMLPDAKKVMIMGNHSDRWNNFIANRTDGLEAWIKTPQELWGLDENGWETMPYGEGNYYKWHDRIFWHGHRAGSKSHISKLELQDAGVSVTTAHINRNSYHEERDALGNLKTAYAHGGFSKDNLHFVKKANSNWSQGFGIYYWDKKVGEQPYMVVMKHGNPRFIGPDGVIYSGENYNLREEIGLEVKRGRGRPRKI